MSRRASRPAAPRPSPVPERVEPAPDSFIRTEVPVLGMTCRTCELRIARNVKQIRSVLQVSASARQGRVIIESSQPLSYRSLERAIQQAGYEIGQSPWLASDPKVWATAGAGLLLVVAVAIAAQLGGLSRLAAAAGELSTGGIVVALLLGLAAGVSTCMALVGGLVLAVSASFQGSSAAARSGVAALRPAIVLVTGRIVGYGVFGAALGAIGASVAMPPLLTAGLMLVVAGVMTLLGARLTELSPRLAGWSPTLPLGLSQALGLGGSDRRAYSDGRTALLGAATFFLPCGFTQAVQIFALSTGSPIFGGALLAAFAIGTAPGLLAVAGLPAVVPATVRPTLLRLVGVAVLGFAVLNGTAALQLAGIGLPSFGDGGTATTLTSTIAADGSSQALTTNQDADGYSPRNVTIAAGIPTAWTIESSTTASCAATLVIPAWNTGANLKLGPNILSLPALDPGVVHYSCAMGMYSGTITVIERPASAAVPPDAAGS